LTFRQKEENHWGPHHPGSVGTVCHLFVIKGFVVIQRIYRDNNGTGGPAFEKNCVKAGGINGLGHFPPE